MGMVSMELNKFGFHVINLSAYSLDFKHTGNLLQFLVVINQLSRIPKTCGNIFQPGLIFSGNNITRYFKEGLYLRKLKYCTSNDANAKVEVNDGGPKRSGYHSDTTQQSAQHDYGPASIAIDQHAAHWSCKEKNYRILHLNTNSYLVINLRTADVRGFTQLH